MGERYTPPKQHHPDGDGFGKAYVPAKGATFLIFGAEAKSIVALTFGEETKGRVAIDLGGKWNHAAEDTLSCIANPETAREMAEALIEAADAAEQDERAWKAGRRS